MTPRERGAPLTREEVEALEPGTTIVVIWSGGNGPHEYVVSERNGTLYAGDPRNGNAISGVGAFVGQERYHTRVWMTPNPRRIQRQRT